MAEMEKEITEETPVEETVEEVVEEVSNGNKVVDIILIIVGAIFVLGILIILFRNLIKAKSIKTKRIR